MSFQNYPETFQMQYPYKGINVNANNDPSYARYIQNMLTGDNRAGKLRYGTNLVSEFAFDANRTFRDIIHVMSFLKPDGTAEKLVYVQYIYQIPNLNVGAHVTTAQSANNALNTTVTINISTYTAQQKEYFKKIFFEGVYLFVRQTVSFGADIFNYAINGDIITFDVPFVNATFTAPYQLWIERGGIYRLKPDNTFELILDDLDPCVIVSHINFQNKLLIANGVDKVKVYDGQNIVDLRGVVSAPITGNITVNAATLRFNIAANIVAEIQDNIIVGSELVLINDAQVRQTVNVTNIAFAAPVNNLIEVTITTNPNPQVNTKKILYTKPCPAFSYLAIAHKRLWALPEGRRYKNKFRAPELSMRVYYAAKLETYDGWFNERSNQIDFIDGSLSQGVPDNFEAIKLFQGKVYFIGRERTQIWVGEDPNAVDDGQNLQLPDFKWFITIEGGILQQNMVVEIPNYLIMVSKYGVAVISPNNLTQIPETSFAESDAINNLLQAQIAFIESDRDYRRMRGFIYPYGRFLGIKIRYSCLIYQIMNEGGWTLFTENFAEANSFFYDATSQNLFLGQPNGKLITYADKIQNQSFEEYGKGKLSWSIDYNWIYPGTTWVNTKMFLSTQSLKKMTVAIRIFLDRDETRSIKDDEIILQQYGVLYDTADYDDRLYSLNKTKYSHESIRFTCDCYMLQLSGLANDLFVFDRLVLAGGTQSLNSNSAGGRNAN